MAEATNRNVIERMGDWFRSIPEFSRQVRAEGKKIVWPTRKATTTTAIMVVILTVMLGIFFFAIDNLFNWVVHQLLKLVAQ